MRLSLTRVRWAFLVLGATLLGALGLLVRTALDRLAHQRALRHEVVAERIFDELERELGAHLGRESARPSSAYDVEGSRAEAWAPFVVGYFTVADGYRVVSREQLAPARSTRIAAALERVWPSPAQREQPPGAPPPPSSQQEEQLAAQARETVAEDTQDEKLKVARKRSKALLEPKSSPEVLRRLNRAQEAREQKSPKRSSEKVDPFGF